MLIINAIPAHMYEAEACGTTPHAPMQFVQQERNSYSWVQILLHFNYIERYSIDFEFILILTILTFCREETPSPTILECCYSTYGAIKKPAVIIEGVLASADKDTCFIQAHSIFSLSIFCQSYHTRELLLKSSNSHGPHQQIPYRNFVQNDLQ